MDRYHIESVKNKASYSVYASDKLQNLIPIVASNIKLTIYIYMYNSLFRSYVENGISCLGRNACPEMKKKNTVEACCKTY